MKSQEGLKKSLSRLNVWSIALGSIIGWGAFVMPGDMFLPTAGPLGSSIGMLLGAVMMMVISVSYGYMISRFPVAGGEFEYASKAFGKGHGFVCSWFLSISYIAIVPLNATALGLIGRYMFPGILQRGYLYTVAGWEIYLGEILLASLALMGFAYINIKGVKILGIVQTVLTFLLIGTVMILTIVAFVEGDFNHLRPLCIGSEGALSGIFIILSVSPWAYIGFDTIPQLAEEFNFLPNKSLALMVISLLFGALIYIAMNLITAIVFPWQEFLAGNIFWPTGAAIEVLLGNLGLFLLGIALVAAMFAGMMGFFNASSRLLYSMAREGILPSRFARLDERYQTPANAVFFVLFVSLISPWFGRAVLGWIVDMASLGAAIGYFYTTASAYKLSKAGGDKRVKLFSGIGTLFALGFVVLLIIPGMPAFLSFPSWVALILWSVIGWIFYSRMVAKGS